LGRGFARVKTFRQTATKRVSDLKDYLSTHPDALVELASLARITDINKASLEMYDIEKKEDLLKNLSEIFDKNSFEHFQDEILGLASPLRRFTWEGSDTTFNGKQKRIIVTGSIPEANEKDWSKVIVSISDITERKRAEESLAVSEKRFRAHRERRDNISLLAANGTLMWRTQSSAPGICAR
jgi:PAS domain S-box-containing protein